MINNNSTNPFVQAALNFIMPDKALPKLAKLAVLLAVDEPQLSEFNLECAAKEALRQAKETRKQARDAKKRDAYYTESRDAYRKEARRRAFRIFDEKAEEIRLVAEGREWLRRHRAKRAQRQIAA
jgi:hypothetical protein